MTDDQGCICKRRAAPRDRPGGMARNGRNRLEKLNILTTVVKLHRKMIHHLH